MSNIPLSVLARCVLLGSIKDRGAIHDSSDAPVLEVRVGEQGKTHLVYLVLLQQWQVLLHILGLDLGLVTQEALQLEGRQR